MKNNILAAAAALLICATATGAPLTREEALDRVLGYNMENGVRRAGDSDAKSPRYVRTIGDIEGMPAVYLYTYSGDEGFMLVAADDAVAPLLGYSATNGFDADLDNPSLKSWMSLYCGIISDARERGEAYEEMARRAGTKASEQAPIGPLLTTQWDQGAPYNNQTPVVGSYRCVTGCVATAMAQVMNYWKYPSAGRGSINYRPDSFSDNLTLDFSETAFQWDKMRDTYRRGDYTLAEANAVATLMKACGYSVRMAYSPSESGAQTNLVAPALIEYFGYDNGVVRKERSSYSSNDAWNRMIYNELQNVGPVILDGLSETGGHSFVCDGYDGNGFFHINWGWGGMSDGYFLLNELTPSEIGTGGHYGGYNMSQDAIIGIIPPVGRLIVNDVFISNAAGDSGNVSGKGYIYRINNFSNIEVTVSLKIVGGHITSPLYVDIYETDPVTLKNGDKVLSTTFSDNLNASDGEVEISTVIRMEKYDVSKFYTLNVSYDLKGQRTTIGSLRMAAGSGVDEVTGDDLRLALFRNGSHICAEGEGKITLTLFDLSGRGVAETSGMNPTLPLDGLSPGIYMARGVTSTGETRSMKLLLR